MRHFGSKSFLSLLALLLLASLAAGMPQAARADSGVNGDSRVPEGTLAILYQATGVRDATGVATAVHCTNTGASSLSVVFEAREFNGTVDCTTDPLTVAANRTVTFSTRDTEFYFEDRICSTAPLSEQGSVYVLVDSSGDGRLVCTAQVLDAANPIPSFITNLNLFGR